VIVAVPLPLLPASQRSVRWPVSPPCGEADTYSTFSPAKSYTLLVGSAFGGFAGSTTGVPEATVEGSRESAFMLSQSSSSFRSFSCSWHYT
jgi:hypothetical protein